MTSTSDRSSTGPWKEKTRIVSSKQASCIDHFRGETAVERGVHPGGFLPNPPEVREGCGIVVALAMCLLLVTACEQVESAKEEWGPNSPSHDADPHDADAGNRRDTERQPLPPPLDAGRTDSGELPCNPQPICDDDQGCRLDIELPFPVRIDIETKPSAPAEDLANGELQLIPSSRPPGMSVSPDAYRSLELDPNSERSVELPRGTYDVVWLDRSPGFTFYTHHLLRDDFAVVDAPTLTITGEDLRTPTLFGELLLRGRTLEYWARDAGFEASEHVDVHTKWVLRLVDTELGTVQYADIEGDKFRYDIELPPSTYDVYAAPEPHIERDERYEKYALTSAPVRGAVDGFRRVAEGLSVEGDTRLDIALQPVKVRMDLSTKNLDSYTDTWVLSFVGPDGQVFQQPADLGPDSFEFWMYPGTYSVWLSPYSAERNSGRHAKKWHGRTIPLVDKFTVRDGEQLSAEAELVEWRLELTVDDTPIEQWAREQPQKRPEPQFDFVLRGLEQPYPQFRRTRFDPARPRDESNYWSTTSELDDSGRSTWAPPGRYELYVDALSNGYRKMGTVSVGGEATETKDLQLDRIEVQFRLNGESVEESFSAESDAWWIYFLPGHSEMPSWNEEFPWQYRGLLGLSSLERPSREGWMYQGSYSIVGGYSGYDSHVGRRRLRRDDGVEIDRYFRRSAWHTSKSPLTIDLQRRRLAGQIGEQWRARIKSDEGYGHGEHWFLIFEPVEGGPERYRRMFGWSDTYWTWIPPGTYDVSVALANDAWGRIPAEATQPVARCVRAPPL